MRYIDYECDRRGDVGSFVRQYVLRATVVLVRRLNGAGKKADGSPWLRPVFMQRFVAELLKQSLEPLSRLRIECCALFKQIHEIQAENFYPHQDRLSASLK